MSYSLAILWHERSRYLAGVLAVGFSALLIALQGGLLLGLFSITSIPIDNTSADVWVGAPEVPSVDLGRHIREDYFARVAVLPEVERTEIYMQGFAYWSKPNGGIELCMVIGCGLEPDSLGKVKELTPEMCEALTEDEAIVIDESDMGRLGIKQIGDTAEITGRRVRVVGLTKGLKSLAGPYVFCKRSMAQERLRMLPGQCTYILAKCHNPADAPKVVDELKKYDNMSAFTSRDFSLRAPTRNFSFRSRWHWLTKTKAGIALGYAAALGLLVGAVVTYQTLSAATKASLREYAVLRALGIPRWRMGMMVVSQSFWVGVVGVCLALPAIYGSACLAEWFGVRVELHWWLLTLAAGVTMLMAMLSGLLALRALRHIEPVTLLR
jgi:putative ABC transport system permease protein